MTIPILTSDKKTTEKAKSTNLGAVGFILGITVVWPTIFVGMAWLITLAVAEIVANGVSFWPILALVIATFVVGRWIGPRK